MREQAAAATARWSSEPEPGLNLALDARVRMAGRRRVVLPIDLPRLTQGTLRDLAAPTADVVIVPDRHDRGTNILVLPPAAVPVFRFAYGAESCRQHAAEAARLGLHTRRLRRTDAAFDLDTPADLSEAASAAF